MSTASRHHSRSRADAAADHRRTTAIQGGPRPARATSRRALSRSTGALSAASESGPGTAMVAGKRVVSNSPSNRLASCRSAEDHDSTRLAAERRECVFLPGPDRPRARRQQRPAAHGRRRSPTEPAGGLGRSIQNALLHLEVAAAASRPRASSAPAARDQLHALRRPVRRRAASRLRIAAAEAFSRRRSAEGSRSIRRTLSVSTNATIRANAASPPLKRNGKQPSHTR